MTRSLLFALLAALFVLSACVPGPAEESHGDYLRHKSNRDAYMYQGL